jgi:hypothetical protein
LHRLLRRALDFDFQPLTELPKVLPCTISPHALTFFVGCAHRKPLAQGGAQKRPELAAISANNDRTLGRIALPAESRLASAPGPVVVPCVWVVPPGQLHPSIPFRETRSSPGVGGADEQSPDPTKPLPQAVSFPGWYHELNLSWTD